MSGSKIETATGMCIVALTKHIMEEQAVDFETAYKRLLSTELYRLLQDAETRLFLETNEYLNGAYDAECKRGEEALYQYIEQ